MPDSFTDSGNTHPTVAAGRVRLHPQPPESAQLLARERVARNEAENLE